MPHRYMINPHTGRRCIVGGPTHKRIMARQNRGMHGAGIPDILAGLLLKEVGVPLGRKAVKKLGRTPFVRKAVRKIRGRGVVVAGSGLKLAGQGQKKRRCKPVKIVFR